MPKSSVTDPITDQEIAFAHLLLSGTMNDREAAEAAGLNPTTAAYTKSKPRIRQYMEEHRAAVREKLVDQEAEGLRKLSIGRDQILARLWELANLPPEATKGSITGQIKAVGMISAIEGHLPDRMHSGRPSPASWQPASPVVNPNIYVAEWLRERQNKAAQPAESVTAAEAKPAASPESETPPRSTNDTPSVSEDQGLAAQEDPFKGVSWAPNAIGPDLDTYGRDTRQPFTPWKARFGRGR